MYNETYEDYIRSILGYPNYSSHHNCMENTYQNMSINERNSSKEELEACYPEIYKVVYPMVSKACSNNTRPITAQLIEELTNEIYLSVESDNEINVTINLNNEVSSVNENRSASSRGARENNRSNINQSTKVQENRGEDRQFRNRGLQDLIRILLIRELLGRPGGFPGNRPPRPPMPPHGGGRPPFPPPVGPGGPGPRPPIMPRDSSDFSDLYER